MSKREKNQGVAKVYKKEDRRIEYV